MENLLTARKRPPNRLLLALCVYVGVEGGGKFVLIREEGRSSSLGERMGDSSGFFLTDPSSFSTSSVTLVIEVIGLVMIALFVLL